MILTSPNKHFSGTLVIPDCLTLPHVFALEEAAAGLPENPTFSKMQRAYVPVLCQVVTEWHIANMPEHPTLETWPGSPRNASIEFTGWLVSEVMKIYQGEVEIPNG